MYFVRMVQVASMLSFTALIEQTLVIITTFGIMFIVRSILIIYSAATSTVIPLMIFSLLELVPVGGILPFVP